MELSEALDALEKVTATEEEKRYWKPLLEAGIKAEEEIERLEDAEAKVTAEKEQAEERLRVLKEGLPGKYLAFALGKPRRQLYEYKTKISEATDLVSDLSNALPALKQPTAAARHKIGQGMRIRDKVVMRIKEAQDAAGK